MFENLDFVYLPSRDVAGDLERFVASWGASLVFAIEALGTRVAMVHLTQASPALLLAGHLEGEQPVLVYRVADLERTITELESRGADLGAHFEIPHGPGVELISPGPQRLALYQLTRPAAPGRLHGLPRPDDSTAGATSKASREAHTDRGAFNLPGEATPAGSTRFD